MSSHTLFFAAMPFLALTVGLGCSCGSAPESPPGPGPVSPITHVNSGTVVPIRQDEKPAASDPAKASRTYYGAGAPIVIQPPARGARTSPPAATPASSVQPANGAAAGDTLPANAPILPKAGK